jgi:hypothetical protein
MSVDELILDKRRCPAVSLGCGKTHRAGDSAGCRVCQLVTGRGQRWFGSGGMSLLWAFDAGLGQHSPGR